MKTLILGKNFFFINKSLTINTVSRKCGYSALEFQEEKITFSFQLRIPEGKLLITGK